MTLARRQFIYVWFIGLAVVIIASTLVLYAVDAKYEELATRSLNERKVFTAGNELLSALKDAETGQRGYLLTEDPKYLDAYQLGVENSRKQAVLLSETDKALRVDDAPGRAILIDQIQLNVDAKLAELQATIRQMQDGDKVGAIATVKSDTGKRLMDELRADLSKAEKESQGRLDLIRSRLVRLRNTRTTVVTFGALIYLGFLAWSYYKVQREIAARIRATIEAQEQRESYAITLSSIGDAVISTDDGGRITFMNAVAESLTGWSNSEAMGRPLPEVFRIISEGSRQPVESPVDKVLRLGTVVGLANHTLLIRKDLTELPIDDSGAPIKGADGRIRGVVLVFRDFTEHKNAEKELLIREERFRLAIDAAELGTFTSNAPFTDIHWNDRSRQLFFVPPEVPTTTDLMYSRIGESYRDYRRAAVDKAMREKTNYDAEYPVFSPDGKSTRWIRSIGKFYYNEAGQPTRFDGVAIDISQKKAVETEISAARERADAARKVAEEAVQAKDQFLATLSHELRTPLTPVLATLTSWESEPGTIPASGDIQMLRRNIELEARLIDDLLDLTRVARGKMTMQFSDVDVHETLEHTLQICRSDTNAKQLAVNLELGAQRRIVHADSARLEQICWNIVRNAVKFTPAGGKVDISTHDDDGHIRIVFKDSGIGMDADTLTRAFKPFEQGGAWITKQFGGLGLGLAISKALVDAQGGTLQADSDGPGTGSTFTVRFPTTVAAPAPAASNTMTPATPATPSASFRILIVEDHEDTVKTMVKIFQHLGHEVESAGTVATALALAKKQSFDIILSDIGLPDATGIDFITQLRTFCQTPAIALTGFGMEEDVAKTAEAGFNAHATKPINLQRLKSLMEELVQNSSKRNPTI